MSNTIKVFEPPPTLAARLEAIKKTIAALTSAELEFLAHNPKLLEETFRAVRRTDLREAQPVIKAYLAKRPPFPPHPHSVVVKATAVQREEIRRFQLEILKKQGIAAEKESLSKIRGERIDPFADADPEPASDREE